MSATDGVVEIEVEGCVIVILGGPRWDIPVFATTTVINAASGKLILNPEDISLTASGDQPEWICEMTMAADENGRPLVGEMPAEGRTGKFKWLVKEFRLDS